MEVIAKVSYKCSFDHYGPHSVSNGEEAKSELKVFNSVIAANSQLKQLPPRELMTHILSTTESKQCSQTLLSYQQLVLFCQCPQSIVREAFLYYLVSKLIYATVSQVES